MPTPKTDTDRINWMEKMRDDCEGHVLTRCFIPNGKTLRENIDTMMDLNAVDEEGDEAKG